MSSYRHQAREVAFQFLYHLDLSQADWGEQSEGSIKRDLNLHLKHFEGPKKTQDFILTLVYGVHSHLAQIDQKIKDAAKNWTIKRMSPVDLNVLRIACFELLYVEDIPKNVSIDEAIELAKQFGSDESGSFVNGILDNIDQL